jgi:hypothetical protein
VLGELACGLLQFDRVCDNRRREGRDAARGPAEQGALPFQPYSLRLCAISLGPAFAASVSAACRACQARIAAGLRISAATAMMTVDSPARKLPMPIITLAHTVAVMTQPDVGPSRRLYGMMQHLMTLAANGQVPEAAPNRGIMTGDDAVDAVLQLAAVIDEATQAGRIPPERGVHAAAMLMLVRDYVRPLPEGIGEDGSDGVTPDLAELVRVLRQTGGSLGLQG